MLIPHDELQKIDDLSEKNLNLQAYELAMPFGDLLSWKGTQAISLASHLAFALGAPATSSRLASRAWHRDKTNSEAIFYYAIELLTRRGPLPALMFIRKHSDFNGSDKLLGWWYSLQSQLHASLRDFSKAAEWHEQAAKVAPFESWVWVSRSFILEQQDRYEESLEAAMKGLELAPQRRATISAAAHCLTLLERDDEALELLTSSAEKVENGWILKQLSDLQAELGAYDDSYNSLKRAMELMPMLEDEPAKWLYGGLSDAAYMKGDLSESIEFAEKVGGKFFEAAVQNMGAAGPAPRRIQLDVGFLRQHHFTCAPATVSNIARYWKKSADHLDLVEEICYDGTPTYKERSWAESNGWRTREFTLNRDNAIEMLERGVPMTLATVFPGGGHLQAIIGFDERRGTYLLRDPYYRRTDEVLANELEHDQRANGPRVLALVPREKAELLDDLKLDLVESDIYDLLYAIDVALDRHNREDADKLQLQMEQRFPTHRLCFAAQWSIASYDANSPGVRSALQALLDLFPDDVNLRMNDLTVTSQSTSRSERLDKLEHYSKATETDPLFWQMFGFELGMDAREHSRGIRWLMRSLRRNPGNALTYRFLADILWTKRRFEESAELYRIATSLNDKDENLAYTFFSAMRHLKRESEAIGVLKDRARLFINQSGLPVRSLFNALRELGNISEAFTFLDDALAKRPADGELHLFAADVNARFGRINEARALLEKAEKFSPASQWIRVSATVAQLNGDLSTSRELWRRVLDIDPSAFDAHENIAFLTKGLEGSLAAKDHLRRACRKFPMNRGLQTLRLYYLDDEAGEAIAVLRDLLRRDTSDSWCNRELSHWYRRIGKFDRSLESAESAVASDPNDGVSRWFRGQALEALGRFDEAIVDYEAGVRNSVDHGYSISSWLNLLRTKKEKLAALDVIWAEVMSRSITGDGLFAFREESRKFLDGNELLQRLRDFETENPQAWFATSALVQQLVDMGETHEALSVATDAVERFPLVHQCWLDLSLVHKLSGNSDAEIEALRKAVSINPTWSYGAQQLADALERTGRFAEAKDALVSALSRLPFDNFLHGYLASVYWKLNERKKALDELRDAVVLEPSYEWAWRSIRMWAGEAGDPDLPVKLARELTIRKPRDPRSWTNLAEMLERGAFSQEQLDAAEQALRLDRNDTTALAIKANCLADSRKYDEAILICNTVMPDGHRPEQLQFVEAGIEMNRGRVYRGLEIMQALVSRSPGYLPGWARLADIYRNDPNRSSDYLHAASQLVRLSPRESTAYGYLAEASLQCGKREEAREALQQAVNLDPSYQFAGDTLFSILVEDGDTQAAEQLASSLMISASEVGLPMAIEVAVSNKDRDRVLTLIAKMLRSPIVIKEKADAVMAKASSLFDRKDQSLENALRDLCQQKDIQPITGRYLIAEVWRTRARPGCEEILIQIAEDQPLWAEAANRYLEILNQEKPSELANFIDQNAEALGENTETWATVGYIFSNWNDYYRMSKWFDGWEQRSGLKPWMLWNYTIVLRQSGMASEAERVSRAAVDLAYDDTINLHLTFIAIGEFGRRNIEEARKVFSSVNSMAMTDWDRYYYDLLADGLAVAESVAGKELDAAKSITDGLIASSLARDPKQKDRMTREATNMVLDTILSVIDSRWYTLKVKAKRLIYSI